MEKFGNRLLRDSIRTILKVNLHPIMLNCKNCRYEGKGEECNIKWGANNEFCNQIIDEIARLIKNGNKADIYIRNGEYCALVDDEI